VHVTASAALIVGRRGVILHRHRLLGVCVPRAVTSTPTSNRGRQPSARPREETSLRHLSLANGSSDLVHVDVHPGPRSHTHLDLRYLLDGDDGDPAPPPDESQDAFWFTWAEALRIAEPSVTGALTHLWRSRERDRRRPRSERGSRESRDDGPGRTVHAWSIR
jgi:hypothetical protein